ncbi:MULTISPECIES: alpha/beta hydrolase [Halomonadaceae]|uniref:Alpha/beta hydrolase n=1 Tax=Vreelandella piezotolerans TaxID=2609667 RepID=A0ABQ6XCS7_9GAMM|nr:MULTISPECIES: alpha/beta hydrolase [Halomonas]MEC9021936.1 alpha/beta hydrolase [Pseudomonadota bacterium]HAV43857.1 alpha/beta hydrolase [Halomonas sp.]KAE8439821.1 alpha/beta hydrolase [Halomonas piezotolerans]MCC4292509.1 alpha/beta hydrolase [Halomonas axialensis]MCF2914323.1 alpha/beta hydrolase [Halomonas sp. Cn5-12]
MTLTPAIHHYDRWVSTPNGRLFTRTWEPDRIRSEVPILLFHDSLGCVDLWRNFPEALCAATRQRVIAYDRLGFGRSDASSTPLPLSFIDDEARGNFAAICHALQVTRFIALGHSVGGCMAVHCAGYYFSQCQGLVTIAAQAFNENRTRQGIEEAKATFQTPEQFAKLVKYHGNKARWVFDAWTDTWLSPEFAAWSLTPALERVRCPTLVLHGEKDEYGSHRQPERIARYTQGPAHCEMLPGIGHVPHREAEAVVVEFIRQFIFRLDD